MDIQTLIAREIQESIDVKLGLLGSAIARISVAAARVADAIASGHKLLVFGNGGSAADAQHIAAEFVGRYQSHRRALPAIALTTNSSVLTAISNDYGFEDVFARQIEAFGSLDDVALAISTSGDSPNVLSGVEAARRAGLGTIGLTGRTGGKLKSLVDICVCIPSDRTARIQEAHILIGHILCGVVEQSMSLAKVETASQSRTGSAVPR
jgi:D-sedoheptulose 7-phosphate isomerase